MGGKAHVKVFVRTRPTAHNYPGLKVQDDKESLVVNIPKDQAHDIINNKTDNLSFKYDGVLENVSQETVYTCCGHEVVEGVLAGYNGTLMCYGQTGAGKTFSMSGELRNYGHRGLVPRAIQHLYREIDRKVDRAFKVKASYLEVYNEALYDLLATNPAANEHLTVLEDGSGQTYVRGLTWQECPSEGAALEAFFAGQAGRSSSAHALNSASSRSHCVFTLQLEMRSTAEGAERAVVSRLHLVDLAGSERTKKSGATGPALSEANFINKSLSFLEQAVHALARRGAHVPFRQSKLTAVLADALGGGCRTALIANIWNEPHHLEETLSTLRFASRMRCVEVAPVVVESSDPAVLMRRYERQVKELKQELAMRDALGGRGRINYEDMSPAELAELREAAQRYLAGQADEAALPADTIKHIREVWRAMRALYQEALAAGPAREAGKQAGSEGAAPGHRRTSSTEAGAVGDLDKFGAQGFTVGNAPQDSRPPAAGDGSLPGGRKARIAPDLLTVSSGGGALSTVGEDSPLGSSGPLPRTLSGKGSMLAELVAAAGGAGSERNALFLRFKHETPLGQQLSASLKADTARLRDAKVAVRDLSMAVNQALQDMEGLQARQKQQQGGQEQQQQQQQQQGQPPGLEEQLAAARAQYRSSFDALKQARGQVEELAAGVAELRQQQVEAYEAWAAPQGLLGPPSPSGGLAGSIAAYHPPGTASSGGFLAAATADDLDPAEAFDLAERQRIMARDPDSCAYHAALKKTIASPGRR